VLGEAAGDPVLRRQPAQRRGGIAERGAMREVPGDVERLGVALLAERPAALAGDGPEAARGVEAVDAIERRQLEAGVAGVGVEASGPAPMTA
jgi:hypothetical protein